MAKVEKRRLAAEIDGDFVVFLIGAKFGWRIFRNLWFLRAMPAMQRELEKHPDMGLLGYENHLGLGSAMVVQYWRSWEQLEAYARNPDATHFPNWVKFNKRIGSDGSVGIWHETYRVPAGSYEAVYNNMPPYGLGKAGKLVSATGKKLTAAGRLGDEGRELVTPAGDVVDGGASSEPATMVASE
jgi:hypothetical protein